MAIKGQLYRHLCWKMAELEANLTQFYAGKIINKNRILILIRTKQYIFCNPWNDSSYSYMPPFLLLFGLWRLAIIDTYIKWLGFIKLYQSHSWSHILIETLKHFSKSLWINMSAKCCYWKKKRSYFNSIVRSIQTCCDPRKLYDWKSYNQVKVYIRSMNWTQTLVLHKALF